MFLVLEKWQGKIVIETLRTFVDEGRARYYYDQLPKKVTTRAGHQVMAYETGSCVEPRLIWSWVTDKRAEALRKFIATSTKGRK